MKACGSEGVAASCKLLWGEGSGAGMVEDVVSHQASVKCYSQQEVVVATQLARLIYALTVRGNGQQGLMGQVAVSTTFQVSSKKGGKSCRTSSERCVSKTISRLKN